ncbi:MAG: DNA mismatch repair protein MutS, partial [Clostridiales bacterium]|nr:DNA mismatch repair protein MutS [Clostridiales bacterium]
MSLADIDRASLSPMMQQYAEMKESLGDTFLFYRLGDFYEMFFDDAVRGSKILELALTKRDCGSGMRAPMCGVPFHAYRSYADKLVGAGYKVAICEQLEDPALAKGLVKRGLTRILTPGTITDGGAMEDRRNNFLMSVMCIGSQFGIAVADISTGDFEATQLTTANSGEHFINLVSRYSPSEIIHNRAFVDTPEYKTIKTATGIALTLRNERDFSSDVIKTA